MKEKGSIIIAVLALVGVVAVGLQQVKDSTAHDTAIEQQSSSEKPQQESNSGTTLKAADERNDTAASPAPNEKTEQSDISSSTRPASGDASRLSEVPTREELLAFSRQRRMERAIETGTLNEFLEAEASLEQERREREEQRRARLEESRRTREMRKSKRLLHMTDRSGDEE